MKGFPPREQALPPDDRGAAARPAAGAGRLARPDAGQYSPDDEVLYHLSSLLDSVKTGMISLDGEGRIRVFNAEAEALFAVPRQDVLGKSFAGLTAKVRFPDNALVALWERLSDAVWAAGAALDLEYDVVRPGAQRRTIAYSVYTLGRLAWSVGNGVVIMLEDVTRKKELEDQITEGRKRLQAVFDGITDGIQVVDADHRITAVNRSMTALVGATVVIGQPCYAAGWRLLQTCDQCPASETFRTGQPASQVRTVPGGTGPAGDREDRFFEISTFPLVDRGGRVVQVVEYVKDVTERVRSAGRLEHARRLAVLGEMAARVAHEVRNPLNAITGAAHYLAAEYPNDATIQKFTELIKRQSLRVDQVASDILHAARPLKLNRSDVDIDALADQVVASLRETIERQGITVERRTDPALPVIRADEAQIEQAIHNIVKNAVEAMPSGGRLTIVTSWDARSERASIAVQDTGCGIAPEDRDRVLDAFFTTKPQGTGLGLSIVEGVLRNHGGRLSIEQPKGADRGSRIVLVLPAREQEFGASLLAERPRDGKRP